MGLIIAERALIDGTDSKLLLAVIALAMGVVTFALSAKEQLRRYTQRDQGEIQSRERLGLQDENAVMDLKRSFLFVHCVETFGLGIFLAAPFALLALVVEDHVYKVPGLGALAINVHNFAVNAAILWTASSLLWISLFFVVHRLARRGLCGLGEVMFWICYKYAFLRDSPRWER